MKTETPFIICRACGQPIEVTQGPIPMTTPMTDAGNVSPTGETHQPNTGFVRVEELTAALEREQVFRRLWENAALSKSAPDNKAPQALAAKVAETIEWINLGYLWAGGNFNPELANHQVVSDKLREIRELLTALAPYVTAQPATTPALEEGATPDLKRLLGRLLNKHYAMAADEHKEGASDSSVKRHYDEANEAERNLTEAMDGILADLTTARQQLAEAKEGISDADRGLRIALNENTRLLDELATLRTLADELAGALEYLIAEEDTLAEFDHNAHRDRIAKARSALLAFRSSTPAPAPAPDKLKKETNL